MEKYSRREFIKGAVGAGVVLSLPGAGVSCISSIKNHYDAKGLPITLLGNTGVAIPRIVLGLGSRFCHIDKAEEAFEMLNYALDHGLYYWDTAHAYDNTIALPAGKTKPTELVISEIRVGEVVKTRRKEIFLSTKVQAREPSEAMKQIELSLKRLQTDKLDMLKIHGVESMEDVDEMSRKGHLIDIVQKMKDEGVTRFIGFSGHSSAEALKEISGRAEFDSMLLAMNHWSAKQNFDRESIAIPEGRRKKMGVLLMKAVRPKETIDGLNANDLVTYALSLEGPDAVVVGMDSVDVVKNNLDILHHFQRLSPARMKELAYQLEPFYQHKNLPWMQDGYQDGNWV
ncbi:MAG: aldo/keto reductase [Bacteroidales bacterium]|jgi:aryl-alcohol dehydrogenase-like predicted oxidoreductase|nr:aldo/keto reductase [Bacteroidales bacterium]